MEQDKYFQGAGDFFQGFGEIMHYFRGAQTPPLGSLFHREGSFGYLQHMLWLRNKKVIFLLHNLN